MRLDQQKVTRCVSASDLKSEVDVPPIEHSILNRLRDGMAVLDSAANVIFCNDALTAILRQECGLRILAGQLRANNPRENASLKAAIDACIKGDWHERLQSAIPVTGSARIHSVVVSVLPIVRGVELGSASPRPAAMVVVVDTEPTVSLDAKFLREAFHLSDAESDVAVRLLKGETLSEIAEARGITVHTARTQLKSILSKTGLGRQSDLVNLLTRCDSVLRTELRSE